MVGYDISQKMRAVYITGLMLIVAGCQSVGIGKKETFTPENHINRSIPYDVGLVAAEFLGRIERLLLSEHPDYKGMAELPADVVLSIRYHADIRGKRDRKVTAKEAEKLYNNVREQYERNLVLPEF